VSLADHLGTFKQLMAISTDADMNGFIPTKVRKLSPNSASTALCACHRFHDPWFLDPTVLQPIVQIRLRRLVVVGDKLLG
jgi:hypothetical protein